MTNAQNNVKYGKFKIGAAYVIRGQIVDNDPNGLFIIMPTKKRINSKQAQVVGPYNYVSRGTTNNGIAKTIQFNDKYLNEANTLSFAQDTAAIFYQDKPYFTGNKVNILKLNDKYGKLNREIAMYLCAQIRNAFPAIYLGYASKYSKDCRYSILLPVTPSGTPDFEYMEERIRELEEERIRELEEERIRELEAYLKVTGLSDATLTKADQDALDKMNNGGVKQAKFKVGSLFDIQKVRGINKSGLTVPNDNNGYDYVTRTSKDNGVESQTGLVKARELNEAGTYSLGLLQMTFFYRNKPWYAGQFVRKIVPKQKLSQKTMLYFLSIFNKMRPVLLSTLVRHVDDKFTNLEIALPITSSGDIDFDFMENYITAIEKQSICGVIKYKDKMIQTTKDVVNAN